MSTQEMAIKDLIRELRAIYTCSLKEAYVSGYDLEKYSETFNQIESTIIEFWKYKQMWEELESEVKICGLRKIFTKNVVFGYLLDTLKQKYFPKDKVVK